MDVEQFSAKTKSNNHSEESDQESMRERLPTDWKGVENDVRVDLDMSAGSCRYLCSHASNALRVRSSTTKDRHCKVNTPKGHRDRRVRLAVSTAVQLYNLQDRLGLDQPSKVLDWLMSKAKSAIDELPRPSFISNLNCPSCNTIQNNDAPVVDVVSTSRASDRISHSVPKILPFSKEKTENRMGCREAFMEERKGEDPKVAANNIVRLSMLQNRAEASGPVTMCSEGKKRQPSVLLKKGYTQAVIPMISPFSEQPGRFDVGFNYPENIDTFSAPFSSLPTPSHQEGTATDLHSRTPPTPFLETEIGTAPQRLLSGSRQPFVFYSSHFDSSQYAGETNYLSEKCTRPLVSSLQDNDSIYLEEALRLSGHINNYINTGVLSLTPNPLCESIASSSTTTDSTDGTEVKANGTAGNGLDRLKH